MTCTKLRYQTEDKAKKALKIVRKKHKANAGKIERSFYVCPSCKLWHLSSKLQRV